MSPTAPFDRASFDPGAAAGRATDAILHDTLHGAHRGVVVDSPPGAGKSTLVVRAARELAAAGRPLMVIAQTNAQVDDLVLRLAEKDPELPVGRLHSSDPDAYDKALDDLPFVRTSTKAADLAGLDVVVSTAAKWAHVKDVEPWRHAIVDEAYQMRSDALLAVAGLFERALFVGDPGQLDPFSIVGAEQWAGLAYDPSASAVTTLLAHNPELPQHRLPVSWRLPASAAPLVSAAFYPYTPFRSGTDHGDRTLHFGVPSDGSGPDRVIDEAAESGWGLLELPARNTPRTDPEAVRAVAQVVRRLLDRGGAATSERGPDPTPLTADRIA
ncbi:AAA domain-containing protein, partial [Streptomyces rectiviolaceus]